MRLALSSITQYWSGYCLSKYAFEPYSKADIRAAVFFQVAAVVGVVVAESVAIGAITGTVILKIRSYIMKSIKQESTLADLMIWVAIFGIQAAVAIFTYGQSSTALLMA